MSRTSRNISLLLLLVASATLPGCAHRTATRSAYKTFYQSRLVEAQLPTHEEIASIKDSLSRDLNEPVSKVWEACLGLAAQSKGVLAASNDPTGSHRLLLIRGETMWYRPIQAPPQKTFVERWLAISVLPTGESTTKVNVAYVSPVTARVAPFSTDILPAGFTGEKTLSVSRRAAGAFILALDKTFLEDRYLARLDEGTFDPAPRGTPLVIEAKPFEKRQSVALQRGNYVSAFLRSELLVLDMPRLEKRIGEVIHDLARAANQPGQEARIFILAAGNSPQIEANGDLFIPIGILDNVQSIDELAGILAHELAHIYLHHGSTRVGASRRAGASRNLITGVFMVGGAVIHLLSTIPDSAAPQDSLLTTQDVLVGVAVQLGAYYLSSQIGTGIGRGVGSFFIHRSTRQQELEADEYGTELLWAAGYDHKGLLKFLQRKGISMLSNATKK